MSICNGVRRQAGTKYERNAVIFKIVGQQPGIAVGKANIEYCGRRKMGRQRRRAIAQGPVRPIDPVIGILQYVGYQSGNHRVVFNQQYRG